MLIICGIVALNFANKKIAKLFRHGPTALFSGADNVEDKAIVVDLTPPDGTSVDTTSVDMTPVNRSQAKATSDTRQVDDGAVKQTSSAATATSPRSAVTSPHSMVASPRGTVASPRSTVASPRPGKPLAHAQQQLFVYCR